MTAVIGWGVLNLVLALFFGPLFEGFSRKYIKAQIAHSRQGPLVGVWQPFLDLLKLLGKEDLEVGLTSWQRLAPVLCLGSALCAALLVPLVKRPPLDMGGDVIVFIYVLGLSAIAIILGGMATGTPYAYAGATREMMMYLLVELALVMALVTAMVNAHSLRFADLIAWHTVHGASLSMLIAAFALFMALQAQFGKLPFDIPEAEQEIIGGPFIEMSGPKLALFKWAIWVRQFVLATVLVKVFFPWPHTALAGVNLILTLVKVLLVFVLIGLIEVVTPRLRIDQALQFYLWIVITGVMAVVLAFVAG
ncbi:MAG TPA: NADH-quinone oxidoreductase subunit H [Armatimonadetes bacterium]|nr:NADH-quinone oxidoreductase subunit H [Armatimonadota bacterium]